MKTFREFILECELVEGIEPLPREKMLRKIKRKSMVAKDAMDFRKENEREYKGDQLKRLKGLTKRKIGKEASQIKKMKSKLRTHDPVDSRFRELENRDRGEKNKK